MVAILVILTILTFIAVDMALTRREERRKAAEGAGLAGKMAPVLPVLTPTQLLPAESFTVPQGIFLHGGHTWAHLEVSGDATVGMDDFAQGIIGKIDRITAPPIGAKVRQGEKLFSVHQDGKRIELVSPLDGVVRSVSETAGEGLEKIKREPYRAGWLLSLEPTNLAQNLRKLRIASEASRWLETELKRFAEFLAVRMVRPQEVGVTLPDGGIHIKGIVEKMDENTLEALTNQFLR